MSKICEFDGCVNRFFAKGLCRGHYAQVRRGAVLTPLRGKRREPTVCSFGPCVELVSARGLCPGHYSQAYAGQELRPIVHGESKSGPCKFAGCESPRQAVGLCAGHYSQRRVGKSLSPIVNYHKMTDWERFETKLVRLGEDECWPWGGAVSSNSDGYGKFNLDGITTTAHRAHWILVYGPIPEGKWIDHLCHNRACVNLRHLRLATPSQNASNLLGLRTNNTSGIRGVCRSASSLETWIATVSIEGESTYLGSFRSAEDAELAVHAFRSEHGIVYDSTIQDEWRERTFTFPYAPAVPLIVQVPDGYVPRIPIQAL